MQLLWEIKKKDRSMHILRAVVYIVTVFHRREKRVLYWWLDSSCTLVCLRYFALSFRGPVCFFFSHCEPPRFRGNRDRVTLRTFLTLGISNINVTLAVVLFFLRREKCITMPRNNSSWLINICATVCNLSSPISRTFRGPSRIFEEYICRFFFQKLVAKEPLDE